VESIAKLQCVLCGSREITKISDRIRGGMTEGFTMRPHECNNCGLVFLHPLMNDGEAEEFYRETYRHIYHGPDYDISRFHEARKADARRRRDRLLKAKLLNGVLLEIGSSTGAFLELINSDVAQCFGVEFDERQRAFSTAHGMNVYKSYVEIPQDVHVDTIVMFHVLEHVSNPVAFLSEVSGLLRRRGRIIIEVPNVCDALLSRYSIPEFAAFYWHPGHSYYFSKDTLLLVAKKANLEARVEPVQRYSLGNHLHWAVKRSPGGQDWLADVISAETARSYAEDLCKAFICDTLWMEARKP